MVSRRGPRELLRANRCMYISVSPVVDVATYLTIDRILKHFFPSKATHRRYCDERDSEDVVLHARANESHLKGQRESDLARADARVNELRDMAARNAKIANRENAQPLPLDKVLPRHKSNVRYGVMY